MQDKTAFSENLFRSFESRVAPDERRLALDFVKRFWARVPAEDIEERDAHDASGASMMCWRAFRQRSHEEVQITVCNPEYERDGWASEHTVILLVHPDMPFITDSVLMELTHNDRITHHLQNIVFKPARDLHGHLTGFEDADPSQAEVLIYAEIDRLDPAELEPLKIRLSTILGNVRIVVEDFEPLKTRLASITRSLRENPPPVPEDELLEALAYLEWLPNNNFTFLGYREFDFRDGVIRQVPETALGILRNRAAATERRMDAQPEDRRKFLLEPTLLTFSKAGTRARVHRPAYPDYIGIKRFDDAGHVIGECGLLGLYTSPVYTERPHRIPIIRLKVANIRARSGLDPKGFDGKVLAHVLDTYPRDELFQTPERALFDTAMTITHIHERRRTSVFIRKDRYGLFYSCLLYMPRDLYTTQLRMAIQRLLVETFEARDSLFTTFFSESILVRVHFMLRVSPGSDPRPDIDRLKRQIIDMARDWTQELRRSLIAEFSEAVGARHAATYGHAFPAGYREHYPARAAVADVRDMERLSEESPLRLRLYREAGDSDDTVHLKVFHVGEPLPLSNLLPTLEHMDLIVIGEHPYLVEAVHEDTGSERCFSIQAFELRHRTTFALSEVAARFEDAFQRAWRLETDDDSFNRLILGASLTWREVVVLRAYARYMKQTRLGFSQEFISDTLVAHPRTAESLIAHFRARFDPASDDDGSATRIAVLGQLEDVALLNEDRILRRFLELIDATERTSYFQRDSDGAFKETLTFKIAPQRLAGIPQPVPSFEIFVFSTRMEGVHLRAGPIARGGLRWSDRLEDYRNEILGLLKAQVVKNAVIVPTGAKGGFIVRHPPADSEALATEGIRCYKAFISGLLDVTDNIVDGETVAPAMVRRHDGDDTYLVVAADKGTATFSDIANEVAATYGFWLGDAFASGGSHGYDHKRMGITARGAWVSVVRHFAERGIDVSRDAISVVGIGDMGGDVFGNGMLRSDTIRLVGAFNHRHVFLDPNPDPAASFAERMRLFESSFGGGWSEYDTTLISAGGGVFKRTQKSIPISPEVQACLDIAAGALPPDDLIQALLRAPVDLIWNGGIGTFVRASSENDADVGDRSNDHLRVTAAELRAAAFAEGGNLGMTQLARIEFSLHGGAVNTDFIDNSAGVDCSDHEVNLKILFNEEITAGNLTLKQRNALLESMTDEVAALVLANNFRQNQALSVAERHARTRVSEYQRFILRMEIELGLDRELEAMATDEELTERVSRGGGFMRPELAVLLCYAKMHLKERLVTSTIHEDPVIRDLAFAEFPVPLRERFSDAVHEHRLLREIVATIAANDMVDHLGITSAAHFSEFLGRDIHEIAKAFFAAAECFSIREGFRRVEALSEVPAEIRLEMLLELMQLGRRSTRWFLRNRQTRFTTSELTSFFCPRLAALAPLRSAIVGRNGAARFTERVRAREAAGVPEDIAEATANAAGFATALAIIGASTDPEADPTAVGAIFAELNDALEIDWLAEQLIQLAPVSLWQAMERDALLDGLMTQHARLANRIYLSNPGAGALVDAPALVRDWLVRHDEFTHAWRDALDAAQRQSVVELALLSVTCRKLAELSQSLAEPGAVLVRED
jgi:glutamate dehydrogenase